MNPTEPDPPEIHDAEAQLARGVRAAPGALRFTFSRGSGPGGQNVNKVNTRSELRVRVTELIGLDVEAADRLRQFAGKRLTREDEIVIHASESRSQRDNREACLDRLREVVTKAMVRPKTRRKTKPSRGAKERRLKSKRVESEKKARRRVGNHD